MVTRTQLSNLGGRYHTLSKLIKSHRHIQGLAPLGKLVTTMKGNYYTARSLQALCDDPDSLAPNLAGAIIKLDIGIKTMSQDFDLCVEWLQNDFKDCFIESMRQYLPELENY